MGEAPGKLITHCHQCSTALSTNPLTQLSHTGPQIPHHIPGSCWPGRAAQEVTRREDLGTKSNIFPKAVEIRVEFFLPSSVGSPALTCCTPAVGHGHRAGKQLEQDSTSVPSTGITPGFAAAGERMWARPHKPAGVPARLGGLFCLLPCSNPQPPRTQQSCLA